MLETGTIVGGYRVDGLLGEGGMGTVYRATQLSLDRVVALKVLTGELSDDPAFRERFRREGQRQAVVEHPHIVSVYEAGKTDVGLFLAMRLVEGPTLKALLLARQIDHRRSLKVLTQVADALDAAHAQGLVHRDVKPQNILIGAGDHAYLADFGLTKGSDDDALLTEPGHFVGTIDYISPEQARGEPATGRSDVYSLGCVLVECLTGEVPFPRPSEPSVLFAHLTVAPPTVSDHHPDLPPALDAVIARAMAKDPDDRYASAGELMLEARRAFAAITPGPPSQRTRMHQVGVDLVAAAAPPTPPPVASPVGAGPAPSPAAPPEVPAPAVAEPAPAPVDATPTPTPAPAAETLDGRRRRRAGGGALQAPELELEPAPLPPRPASRGRPWAGRAAILLLVVAAAAAGALVGRPSSPGRATALANSASAGPLELSFPAGWQRLQTPPQTPGLGFANPLVLAPVAAAGARLEAGTVTAGGPTLLPAAFLALLADRPRGEPVRIGSLQALRYAALAPRGLVGVLTLYVVPTSQGVLALGCRGGAAPPAAFDADCARVVATARVVGARAYPLGPSPAFGAALRAALSGLAGARRPAEARLAAATTAAVQAAADRELAGAYARAARQVALAAGGDPQVAGAAGQVAATLGATARAYQRSAAAAAAADPAAYAAAGRDLARAGVAAATASAALRALGYRVSG